MELHLRLLIIEDKENDAQLIFRYLQKTGFSIASERVETASKMQEALDSKSWDIIIADYSLPQFDAPSALKLLQNSGKDIPFIVISGTIGEETAVEMMKAGAHDYLMKDNLIRLDSVIKREVEESKIRRERKQALDALIKSEQTLANLVSNLPGFVYRCANDHHWTMDYLSEGFIDLTGYAIEEVLQNKLLSFNDIIHPDDRNRLWKNWQNVLQVHQHFEDEYRIIAKNGSVRNIWERGHGVFEHDKLLYLEGFITDITERKQAEEALLKSERTLNDIIDFLPEPTLAIDINKKVTIWNKAIEKITGIKAEDIIGKGNYEYTIPFYGDRRSQLMDFIWEKDKNLFTENYQNIKQEGDSITAEMFCNALYNGKGAYIYGKVSPLYDYKRNIIGAIEIMRDITERKQAEEDVKRERILLRTLIDNLPDTIYVKDKEARKIVANCADLELTGYSSEASIIGKNDMEIFGNEVGIRGYTDDMSILQTGNPIINREEDFYDPKGIQRWLITSKIPLRNEKGDIIGLVGIGHDITERKKTEKALIESEERFRSLYENATIGLYRTTPDGQVILANPTLVQMLGFDSLEDLKKRNISEEGYALDYQRKTFQDTIEKQGYIHGLEYAWKRKDGTNIFIRESSRLIRDKNGKSLYYEGTVEDITESKHAEQLQKVLFNISNAAISTNNLKELIETIKQQLSTLLDTSNFYAAFYDETTGMFSSPYYSDEKDAIETWPAEKSLTGCIIKYNKPMLITDEEYLEMNKKGEVNLIGEPSKIWLGVPLRVEGKAIGAFVVQSYDDVNAYSEKDKNTLEFVSHQIGIAIQRTKAMQDLKAALAKAEESDRLKSAFLANMSHEIRTPMNGILGFADLLNDDFIDPDEKRRFINIIKTNGQHLLSIINDIIDISKIDSNQLKITNVNFNLNHLLDELFIAYQNEIVQKGKTEITLQLDKALQDAQSHIISDDIRLRQILYNLISNSLKFTKSGFIRFGYSLSGDNLEFFVQDTGKGIAANKQSIIFERFRQEEETHTRQFGGTGLGLTISKALVELMGGKIWLSSEEGDGSTFYFTIPYIPFVAQPEPSHEKNHQKNHFDFSRKTILAADDVQVNLDLISVYLKKTNASLLFANDGKEALEICKNNPAVDLVLMDIQMPVMNGYEATREIRKFNKDLPVIAFTAYVFANDKIQCLEAGCNDFIPKPMDKNLLLKMLNKYL